MRRVGELMSAITPRLTTEARFRFDMTAQDALDLLAAAYRYEVQRRRRRFVPDEDTERNLADLAGFLTQPVPKFGVMCCGRCGNGKTTLLYAFQRVVNHLRMRHHFDFLNEGGHEFKAGIQIFRARELLLLAADYDRFRQIKERPMLAIDDLGTEPLEKMDYGNVMTPIVELIEHRYDRQLFTFITTNLTPDEIRGKYKDRVADRFNEMLHKIVFNNTSYRTDQ